VPVLRWFLDATRVAQLAADNQISSSTAYRYLHEGIDVLAAVAPGLHGALLAARSAGHSHVSIDGTLIRTDRSKAAGPTAKVDLWWSGKHHHHGGNVQLVAAPDGWPLWTSPVRPGREHDASSSAPLTCCTPQPAPWPSVGTPCSRPRSRRYARLASARGGSARSPPPPWSCSTPSTTGQPDQLTTEKGSVDWRHQNE